MATSRTIFQMDMASGSSQTAISTTVSMSMDTSRDKACLFARSKVGNTRANGKWVEWREKELANGETERCTKEHGKTVPKTATEFWLMLTVRRLKVLLLMSIQRDEVSRLFPMDQFIKETSTRACFMDRVGIASLLTVQNTTASGSVTKWKAKVLKNSNSEQLKSQETSATGKKLTAKDLRSGVDSSK